MAKKIIIIGTSGSGKTTLARQISSKTGIKHIELDSIYNQEDWKPIETEKFITTVNRYTKEDSWIFCGNYFSRLGFDFWEKADIVIWLDYPFCLVLKRVLGRTLKRGVTHQLLWNGNRESLVRSFLTKDSIVLYMIRTWKKQKIRYDAIFAKKNIGNTRLVRVTNKDERDRLLEML